MKSTTTLILVFIICLTVDAQDFAIRVYPLTTSVSTIQLGKTEILDPYLSPYEYSGTQIGLQQYTRRLFTGKDSILSYSNRTQLQIGSALHPSENNSMLFFNTNYTFGVNYHFRPSQKLMILVGGSWDIDLGGKYISRNINNPFSLDLYTNINVTAEAQYKFSLWKQHLKVQYGVQTPLIGCMFVPTLGVSYYELFSLNNMKDAFHFSSLHNRLAWSQYFNLHIPLNHITLCAGVQHDYLQYSANDLVFHKKNLSFQFGTVFDLYYFKGKKNKTPGNFRSSYE